MRSQPFPTHHVITAYILWIVGFMGSHRFYYGKRITGVIWFFTAGLLGIGWLVDLFLIPGMSRQSAIRYTRGEIDYSLAWLLLAFGGLFGLHRFYLGKIWTGVLYLFTGGLFGLGLLYDYLTLNEAIDEINVCGASTAQSNW